MSALTLAGPAAAAFHSPAACVARRAAVQMASINDLPGVSVESGNKVFDPLNLADLCPYGSMQYEWMRTSEVSDQCSESKDCQQAGTSQLLLMCCRSNTVALPWLPRSDGF